MVEIENVSFSYGSKAVVSNVSLSIGGGELVVLLGANGAGKSTLLKLVSGYLNPSAGSVFFDGEKIASMPAGKLARRRSVLEQECALSFDYSVEETVKLGGFSRSAGEMARLSSDAKSALEKVGLGGFENRRYAELSGGEKRRVQLARALCQLGGDVSKKLLLLDEPSAGLDPAHAHAAMRAARGAADEGASVCAVLHDPNLAAAYADKIALLKNGALVGIFPSREIFDAGLMSKVYGAECEIIPCGQRKFICFLPQK